MRSRGSVEPWRLRAIRASSGDRCQVDRGKRRQLTLTAQHPAIRVLPDCSDEQERSRTGAGDDDRCARERTAQDGPSRRMPSTKRCVQPVPQPLSEAAPCCRKEATTAARRPRGCRPAGVISVSDGCIRPRTLTRRPPSPGRPQPRLHPAAEAKRHELVRVLVDPRAVHVEALRDLLGGDELPAAAVPHVTTSSSSRGGGPPGGQVRDPRTRTQTAWPTRRGSSGGSTGGGSSDHAARRGHPDRLGVDRVDRPRRLPGDHRRPRDVSVAGDGLWWAAQTVTTVGYGDNVPMNLPGRLLAVFVMLMGIGFLTVVTAAITSTFVARARRARQPPSDAETSMAEQLRRSTADSHASKPRWTVPRLRSG